MNAINTSAVAVAKAIWARGSASYESKDRVALAVMKQDNNWFLYTQLNTENLDSFAEGENLYRISEEEALEIQKAMAEGVCKAVVTEPLEFAFTRSTKGDVTTISSASSDGTAMFNTLVKGNIPGSTIRIYGTAVSNEMRDTYQKAGFQVECYTEEEQVSQNVAKLLNFYREKITGCPLAN